MKFILSIILVFTILIGFHIVENNESITNENNESITKDADKDVLLQDITNISTERSYGTEGSYIVKDYISKQLADYGYELKYQEFDIYEQDPNIFYSGITSDFFNFNPHNSDRFGSGSNIIAYSDNINKDKRTLYLTAHYDSTVDTSGVIDNATGSAAILEVARLVKNLTLDVNVVFVWFDAEEYFRLGSRNFINSFTEEELSNILGVINVDMVGELNADNIKIHTTDGRNNILSLYLSNNFDMSSINSSSDEFPFYKYSIPAITLTDEMSNPYLSRESAENQLENIDINIICNLVNELTCFINEFNVDTYYKFKSEQDISISINDEQFNSLSKFTLGEVKENIVSDSYTSERIYFYNYNNDSIVIKSEPTNINLDTLIVNYDILDEMNNIYYKFKDNDELSIIKPGKIIAVNSTLSDEELLDILKSYIYIF